MEDSYALKERTFHLFKDEIQRIKLKRYVT